MTFSFRFITICGLVINLCRRFFVFLFQKGMIVKHKFDWIGKEKPISSMFVGTSPEFEIALYTVCFYARPGSRCPVKLNGKDINIQTHYSYRQGKRYVGSAFPDI